MRVLEGWLLHGIPSVYLKLLNLKDESRGELPTRITWWPGYEVFAASASLRPKDLPTTSRRHESRTVFALSGRAERHGLTGLRGR